MTSTEIQKYSKFSLGKLTKRAQDKFNAFIRKRDTGQRCISCDTGRVQEASHFYSGGHYPHMRFNEDNVHGACTRCNRWLHGNLLEYRKRLEKKIGTERLAELDLLASIKTHTKANRFLIIEILQRY